ncbi:Satratoxin biosynthesis SC1 cluster protein [Penicillium riverlandense]|uniref:Satratoxin biosynthesis SC1 cluster protein n=1 Tax=Penicillium riverlandense TaxID=1903569 RepID=UPI0025474133|nr:Satratoxin biosynthesis SC1 cluster protein [Penicillium riverlandense]KAJ5807009.1 Satratoxin biosynthesis SC1 cluster protein [Penicillium riverlandense]
MSGALESYRSRAIFAVVITFTVTSTVSVFLRLLSKRINRARLASEDYVLLVAQFLLYGMASAEIIGLTKDEQQMLVVMQLFYASTLTLIKTSICLFYLRIFPVKRFRIICRMVMGFVACWGIMVILTAFLLCRPLAYNWDQSIPGGKCANERAAFIAVGVLDLVTDVCVFALPLPMIWNLHARMATRAALSSVFGLGILTMVVSILRIVALMATNFADITYTASYPLLWSFLEPALGITVACGPLLGPLTKKTKAFVATHATRKLRSQSEDRAPFGSLHSNCAHASNELGEWPGVVTSVTGPQSVIHHKTSQDTEDTIGEGQGIGVRTEWKAYVS